MLWEWDALALETVLPRGTFDIGEVERVMLYYGPFQRPVITSSPPMRVTTSRVVKVPILSEGSSPAQRNLAQQFDEP